MSPSEEEVISLEEGGGCDASPSKILKRDAAAAPASASPPDRFSAMSQNKRSDDLPPLTPRAVSEKMSCLSFRPSPSTPPPPNSITFAKLPGPAPVVVGVGAGLGPPPTHHSPIPLRHTLSSPPMIDASPKPKPKSSPSSSPPMQSSLQQNFTLTPIIRNTASIESDEESDGNNPHESILVSPDDHQLDREYLSLDIPDGKSLFLSPPVMPPKPSRVNSRAQSVGNLDVHCMTLNQNTQHNQHQHNQLTMNVLDEESEENTGRHQRNNLQSTTLLEGIPLDSAKRLNRSFGNRQQYRRALASAFRTLHSTSPTRSTPPPNNNPNRMQYQPSRDDSLTEIGLGSNLDELSAIFLPRKKPSQTASSQLASTPLHQPIPLEEKQWSIPSIRLANHLADMSTASYTCSDDEDDLYWDEDVIVQGLEDYLEENNVVVVEEKELDHEYHLEDEDYLEVSRLEDSHLEDDHQGEEHGDDEDDDEEDRLHAEEEEVNTLQSDEAVGSTASSFIEEARHKSSNQNPYEWLQQVRESEKQLAEAASSKFLTRGQGNQLFLSPMVERQALSALNRDQEDMMPKMKRGEVENTMVEKNAS